MVALLALAAATGHTQPNPVMNELAERYVKLVLALGQHDADYVDAYYGPDNWRIEAETSAQTIKQIGAAVDAALADLQEIASARVHLGDLAVPGVSLRPFPPGVRPDVEGGEGCQ